MLFKSSVFCRWLDYVMWSNSVVCSSEYEAKMYIFWSSTFQCLLFWKHLQHVATSDFKKFLIFVSCSTALFLYRVDVKSMLQTLFLILLLLSTSVSSLQRLRLMWRFQDDSVLAFLWHDLLLSVEDVNFIVISCLIELSKLVHLTLT